MVLFQYLMQTGWDQQNRLMKPKMPAHCARRHDPLATRMDSMLHRWPNVAKRWRRGSKTEKARRIGTKRFTAGSSGSQEV